MEENNFWLALWAIIATVAITIVVAVTTYCISANATVVELTKAGADPVGAACAINGHGCAAYYIAVAAKGGAK